MFRKELKSKPLSKKQKKWLISVDKEIKKRALYRITTKLNKDKLWD